MSPNTQTLDHIIYLGPTGLDGVSKVSDKFEKLGFKVIPGGTHADGLTSNALVILKDGVYLELIVFLYPSSHYPEGTPERLLRDRHQWAGKPEGWVDYSFLGLTEKDHAESVEPLSKLINERAAREKSGAVYLDEVKGGRERPDGEVLKWVITHPDRKHARGNVPFFCEDVTRRELRVPSKEEFAIHANKSTGIDTVYLLASPDEIFERVLQLKSAIGAPPAEPADSRAVWTLDTVSGSQTRLIISVPQTDEEKQGFELKGPGLYALTFTGPAGKAAVPKV